MLNIIIFFKVELKQLIKQLQREKREVDGTLRDLEWQLDTESKVQCHFTRNKFCIRSIRGCLIRSR